jgi:nitrile hydratase alpha subunit/nitrile hydratase accessory protein
MPRENTDTDTDSAIETDAETETNADSRSDADLDSEVGTDTDRDRETTTTDIDVPTSGASPEARARAVQSLLVEKGLLSTEAVEEIIATYEREIGPLNGARVVARAWTDPEYRERLLADATTAIAELDIDIEVHDVLIEAVPNTEETHNLVVCTLCSCYPWAVLGLPPTWYKSEAYRSRAVREPRALLEAEFGLELDEGIGIQVWDSTAEHRYFVLPQQPPGTEGFTEAELIELVSRDAMIGVDRLDCPPAADGGEADRTAVEAFGVAVEDPTFRAPWQARAFAVAVALADREYDWPVFRNRLVSKLDHDRVPAAADTEASYYERWLSALEAVAIDRDLLSVPELRARAAEFDAGDRTAQEFIEGDQSSHSHDHSHDHDHDHRHDH